MTSLRFIRFCMTAAVVVLMTACAHPISLEPVQQPEPGSAAIQVQKRVAYVMTDTDREREVVTPGGGGDKVSYFPYRDMERSIRAALRSVYRDVTSAESAADATGLAAADVAYVFTPKITTTSSSSSMLTWPPTDFGVEVDFTITDTQNALIAQVHIGSAGHAEFSEFKSDFSLSARRATTNAVGKLSEEVQRNRKLH